MVVTTEEVARRLGTDTTFRLIDARDQQRFVGAAEPIDTVAGHVPGAHNLPFTACLAADGGWCPAEELGAAWRSVLDGDPDGDSAVMCGSGVTACHLILSAELAGFTAPRLYVGSWSEWIRDPGRAIATGPGPGAADSASN
jgi:thiosulfate/3-mercaptopyruvate sulfurtransferase